MIMDNKLPHMNTLPATAICPVFLSALLHGVSATLLVARLGRVKPSSCAINF